jgi:hypothetical protein
MWLVVARKRLPTPSPLRTTNPNPTVIVLPVLRQTDKWVAGAERDSRFRLVAEAPWKG